MKTHAPAQKPVKTVGQVATLCGRDVDPDAVSKNTRLINCVICIASLKNNAKGRR